MAVGLHGFHAEEGVGVKNIALEAARPAPIKL